MPSAEERLKEIYYNPRQPAAFGGVWRLTKKAKEYDIPSKVVQNFLGSSYAYTLHKQRRKSFPTRSTKSFAPDLVWQMDLSNMESLASYNRGFRHIFFIIDVYSRYLWTIPLKNKKGPTVMDAFKTHLMKTERIPSIVHTDRGAEFENSGFQKLLRVFNITYINTFSPHKASIAERVQKTIKQKIFRYLTHANSFNYIDILPHIVHAYNLSYHRSIKNIPAIKTKDEQSSFRGTHPSTKEKRKPVPFKVGDTVRISKYGHIFRKGYSSQWSEELFIIRKIKHTNHDPITLYYLKDLNNESIKGGFYREELQKVHPIDSSTDFKIEKILHSKGRGNQRKYFVKWLGYPSSFNSYVHASQIKRL